MIELIQVFLSAWGSVGAFEHTCMNKQYWDYIYMFRLVNLFAGDAGNAPAAASQRRGLSLADVVLLTGIVPVVWLRLPCPWYGRTTKRSPKIQHHELQQRNHTTGDLPMTKYGPALPGPYGLRPSRLITGAAKQRPVHERIVPAACL